MTPEAEQKICDGLVRVSELTKSGFSPNEAIAKVASEERIPAGHIRLMASAYNTGKTNRQRSDANSLFDKIAEFELADPKKILLQIFPEQVKTAAEIYTPQVISEQYDYEPDWMAKQAIQGRIGKLDYGPSPSPLPRDPTRFFKKADGYVQLLNNERSRLDGEARNSWDKVSSAYSELQLYFRQMYASPLDEVRQNAELLFGKAASVIFDKMAMSGSCCMSSKPVPAVKPKKKTEPVKPVQIKRATITHAVDRSQPPYSCVETIIRESRSYCDQMQKMASFEKTAVELELKLAHALGTKTPVPLAADPTLSILRRHRGEKRAFVGPAMGTLAQGAELGLGAEVSRSIMSKLGPKPEDKLRQDALESLSDPDHDSRLRAIRSQAALHGILNGPYFEGEDPNKVTEIFNNLVHMSPRMADQPLILEAAMRRLAAQGQVDPHDIDQLMGIETKMKQRDRATTDNPTQGE